jgi:hypothetical protein
MFMNSPLLYKEGAGGGLKRNGKLHLIQLVEFFYDTAPLIPPAFGGTGSPPKGGGGMLF